MRCHRRSGRTRLPEPGKDVVEAFRFSTSGLSFEPWISADGTVGIDDVYDDSPAFLAGLSTEDRIRAVDSVSVGDLGIDTPRSRLSEPSGTRVRLTIRSPGEW